MKGKKKLWETVGVWVGWGSTGIWDSQKFAWSKLTCIIAEALQTITSASFTAQSRYDRIKSEKENTGSKIFR